MKSIILSLICLGSLSVVSCKKYADGPTVSVLPRKERIEGKWVAESVKYNSQDSTSKYGDFIWEFTKRYSVILQVKSTKMTGEWSTASNDKDFVIDYDNGTTEKYEILKMTNKEFWLKHKSSQLEFHLKAQ